MPAPIFSKSLPRSVSLAHEIVSQRVSPGDTVIDATVGNGHDTEFLAEAVGPEGTVHGFDIQEKAIESARSRVGGKASLHLHCIDHARIAQVVAGPVSTVMFNLGYLPSGDKTLITKPASTLPALEAALSLLAPGGVITVVAYSGHEGGYEELDSVKSWTAQLDQEAFTAIHYKFLNQANRPPELFVIEKKKNS